MKIWKIGIGTLVLLFLLTCPAFAVDNYSGSEVFYVTSFTESGANSLDGAVSGVSIGASDTAIVTTYDKASGVTRVTHYGVTRATEAEDTTTYPPTVIRPDDVGAGVTSWRIADVGYPELTKPTNIKANYVNAGASTFLVYSGVTLNSDMLAGGMLYLFNTTPIVLGIPSFSSSTPYFMVVNTAGGGVTVQTTDTDVLYSGNDSGSGTALFVNVGNSRNQASFNLVYESGSCAFTHVIGTIGTWDVE